MIQKSKSELEHVANKAKEELVREEEKIEEKEKKKLK
jgi:hypothetical protein